MRPSDKQSRNRKLGVYKPVVFNKKTREDFVGVIKRLESLQLKNVPIYVYEIRVIYRKDDTIEFILPFKYRGKEYDVVADDVEMLYVKALQKLTELTTGF